MTDITKILSFFYNPALQKTLHLTNLLTKKTNMRKGIILLTLAMQWMDLNQTYAGAEVNVLCQLQAKKPPPGGLTLAVSTAFITLQFIIGQKTKTKFRVKCNFFFVCHCVYILFLKGKMLKHKMLLLLICL